MFPIRMICNMSIANTKEPIDVYNFNVFDTMEVVVTGWLVNQKYWVTVPIDCITPEEHKGVLNG